MNYLFIQQIMRVFATQPALQITIRELSKRAKLTYNATHRITQQLIKKGILQQNKFGNVCVISIKKNAQSINLLANAAYQKAGMAIRANAIGADKEDIAYMKLPNNIQSIILLKDKTMMITNAKTADTIFLNDKIYQLITIHELIAILSKNQILCRDISIIQGGEYLYEKIIEAI